MIITEKTGGNNHKIPLDKCEQMYYNIEKQGKGKNMKQNICPVDVIAVCSANGDIRPLRFQMEDEKHQLLRIDIEEVVSSKFVQYVGIEAWVFLCRATMQGRQRLFELKFTIRSHSWQLMRKVY